MLYIKYSFAETFIVPKYFSETSITAHTYRPLGNDAFKLSAILRILVKQQTWKFSWESFSMNGCEVLYNGVVMYGTTEWQGFSLQKPSQTFCNNSSNPNLFLSLNIVQTLMRWSWCYSVDFSLTCWSGGSPAGWALGWRSPSRCCSRQSRGSR